MTVEVALLTVVAAALAGAGAVVAVLLRSRRNAPVAETSPFDAAAARIMELANRLESIERTVTSHRAVLEDQVRGTDRKVGDIAQLFTNDRARGNWGEISLLRIFELGQLSEGRDFEVQVPLGNGTVADAVVYLPGDRRVVIDAKFPVARYLEALDCENPEERSRLLSAQAKELERVGKDLVKRGYADYASGGYVVMYLPSQAVYEAAAENCPDVIESLLAARVVVAGPTALYALVANVAALLTEHRAIRQADEIPQQARELHRRMGTFLGHLCSLGTHLQRAVGAYNQAAGSWERRLSPQLERMVELTGLGSLEAPERVEEPVREFSTTYPRLATGSEGR